LIAILGELTGARPFYTRYSLDVICSNSHISHAKATGELGFHPRPARLAVADAVRWFQKEQAPGMVMPDSISNAAI
jgi:hypothetical protein